MAMQQVLVAGLFSEAGEVILNHLAEHDEYEFAYLDRTEHPEYETFVADIVDYETIRPAFDGQDTVIRLAVQSDAGAILEDIIEPNIIGTYNILKATEDTGAEKFIYASLQRIMRLYGEDLAPDLHEEDYPNEHDPFRFAHETLPKPDGYYGTSKILDEHIYRTHTRRGGTSNQVYSIHISSVRTEQYDHPYGGAGRGVDRGDEHKVEDGEVWNQPQAGLWERGSDEYEEMIKWFKMTWTSQRDFTHLLEYCLKDDSVTYDTFYAISGDKARWFDTDHTKAVLNCEPAGDDLERDSPPG